MRLRWLALLLPLLLLAPSGAQASRERVVSATGVTKLDGRDAYVHVLVAVPRGKSDRAATEEALAAQNARPAGRADLESGAYAFSGLRWDVLPVIQHYNSQRQPLAAQSALIATHATWSDAGSSYRTGFGGTTTRCPSLVQECRGRQFFDGFNDVGWHRLGGSTLGVTWYSTSIDEADMALSTRFRWSNACANVSGRYDVQTVYLHENGHVAGLDHSSDTAAVMYAYYGGARCDLGADDVAGIKALYP
jgi:hypothetical protein